MLKIKELTPFLHGYCDFIDVNDYSTPIRFSRKALEHISGTKFHAIAMCTAGMHLCFTTDAEELSFDYFIAEKTYVKNSGIDICEDGVLTAHFPIQSKGHISYKLISDKKSVVKVFFPAGVSFFPFNFNLGNLNPVAYRPNRMLVHGSSGCQSAYVSYPSMTWAEYVAEHLDAEYINRGIGSHFHDVSLLPDSPDVPADHIFTGYGLNDIVVFDTLNEALDAAEVFLKKLKSLYNNSKIHVFSPLYSPRIQAEACVRDGLYPYSERLKEICMRNGLHFISGDKLVPDLRVLYGPDNLHFNEAGSAVFANNLIKHIK